MRRGADIFASRGVLDCEQLTRLCIIIRGYGGMSAFWEYVRGLLFASSSRVVSDVPLLRVAADAWAAAEAASFPQIPGAAGVPEATSSFPLRGMVGRA